MKIEEKINDTKKMLAAGKITTERAADILAGAGFLRLQEAQTILATTGLTATKMQAAMEALYEAEAALAVARNLLEKQAERPERENLASSSIIAKGQWIEGNLAGQEFFARNASLPARNLAGKVKEAVSGKPIHWVNGFYSALRTGSCR